MKRTSLLWFILLSMPLCQAADSATENEANQLILQWSHQNLSPTLSKLPYHEHVAFKAFKMVTAKGVGELEGEMVEDFVSPKMWRYRYKLGDYQHVHVRNGAQVGELETNELEPIRIGQLTGNMRPPDLRFDNTDIIHKVVDKNVEGTAVRCVEYETVTGRASRKSELCVNPSSGAMLRWSRYGYETTWKDFVTFRDKLYPKTAVVKEKGETILEITSEFSDLTGLSDAMFNIPDGFQKRPACEKTTSPVRIKGEDPIFPHSLGNIEPGGRVMVELKIDSVGKVKAAQVMQSVARDLDEAALEAVRTWSFEPAKCDGTPIERRFTVEINFKK